MKVKKIRVEVGVHKWIDAQVVFHPASGLFEVKIPEEFGHLTDDTSVIKPALHEVINALKELSKKNLDAKTTSKKVIFYRFLSNANIIRNGESVFCSNDISFAENTTLGLFWIVCREIRCDDRVIWVHVHSDDTDGNRWHHGDSEDYTEIDWTPQREAFFRFFETKLEDLILNIDKFLNDKKLIEKIDSGMLLLEEEKKKE
jgi:hypothetical protein